jgi:surface polysaccharide O-acyltransferase-like enzyme
MRRSPMHSSSSNVGGWRSVLIKWQLSCSVRIHVARISCSHAMQLLNWQREREEKDQAAYALLLGVIKMCIHALLTLGKRITLERGAGIRKLLSAARRKIPCTHTRALMANFAAYFTISVRKRATVLFSK